MHTSLTSVTPSLIQPPSSLVSIKGLLRTTCRFMSPFPLLRNHKPWHPLSIHPSTNGNTRYHSLVSTRTSLLVAVPHPILHRKPHLLTALVLNASTTSTNPAITPTSLLAPECTTPLEFVLPSVLPTLTSFLPTLVSNTTMVQLHLSARSLLMKYHVAFASIMTSLTPFPTPPTLAS